MTASPFKPAVREGVGLLIGLAGPTGSGKTMSALRLARGLAGGDDTKIAFIDTEARRALHYAASAGEAPGPYSFGFQHADLAPQFTPERYLELIEKADGAGFSVIVIDSFSHEWDGDGGLTEIHDVIHERMGGQDKQSIAAWKEPKLRHKRLVSRLLQCRAHLVICMRAEDKLRMETVEKEDEKTGRTYKKTVITPAKDLPPTERWVPVCEKRFPYELITSFVVTPDRPGVPIPLKLQEQHRAYVPLDKPLDERVGEALAAWARGERKAGPRPAAPLTLSETEPHTIPLEAEMSAGKWQAWAKALRSKISADPDRADAWLEHNGEALVRLASVSPALRGWIFEVVPRTADELDFRDDHPQQEAHA